MNTALRLLGLQWKLFPGYCASPRLLDTSSPVRSLGQKHRTLHGTELIFVPTVRSQEHEFLCVKGNASKQWIVAQTLDTLIHVYDCVTQIKWMASFGVAVPYMDYYSIAIHPTKPYVLSTTMKLWEGDKGWECAPAFESRDICEIAFNPEDPNSFVTVSADEKVEVWSLDSSEPNYHMSGHSEKVISLAFFKRGDRQYLITGSKDCTAKVWDLQKKECIHTLEGFMSAVGQFISLPGRPYLITCSLCSSSTIQLWSSTDFRLKRTVTFSGYLIRNIACFMDSRRIAIGQPHAISVMDIDDEEADTAKGNNEDCTFAMG